MVDDRYGRHKADITSPASQAVEVSPSDTTELPVSRGLWVGGQGNVTVDFVGYENEVGATDVEITNVTAGSLLPIRVVKVKAATTATDIVLLY